jgi:two-component system, chemotaxis family, chemotaxis protein CheY
MIDLEDELAEDYLAECQEHLIGIQADLIEIQAGGDGQTAAIERAFRALHWMQGGAGFFDLRNIGALARSIEHVLGLMRSRKLPPTRVEVSVLLEATDRLENLVRSPGASNQADVAAIMAAVMGMEGEYRRSAGSASRDPERLDAAESRVRMLLVEDDFASRLLLQTFLSQYGECHVAVNGKEAVDIFRWALERGQRYDLICMDIMMPEMDGREAVRHIRALEEEHGILSTSGVKIVMTTAVDDAKEVIRCFHELCDSYLTKPIDLTKLLEQMTAYRLVRQPAPASAV